MFEKLRAIKGAVFLDSVEAPAVYGSDTGGARRTLMGAVVVSERHQVQAVLAWANEHKKSIWPISGGRNFGYGTALPVASGALILDMSQLKKIRYNPSQQTIEIDAGVTQADLQAYLEKAKLKYLVPTTGAGPHGSLIGNAMDGGYGLVPVGDHFDGFSRLAGYWGDGSEFDHTFASMAGSQDMAGAWGAGLGMDYRSLLRQGNLGIVTHGTLQLAREPEASALVLIEWSSSSAYLSSQETLSLLMEQIPQLKGILSMSSLRAMASVPGSPLATLKNGDYRYEKLKAAAKKTGMAAWTGLGTLYGSREALAGAGRDIQRRLKPWAKVRIVTPQAGAMLLKLRPLMPSALRAKVSSLGPALKMLAGKPVPELLQLAYALDKKGLTMTAERNPAKDGQGILWYAPLVPLSRSGILTYINTVEAILLKHGFDPLLAATTRSSRICTATVPLLFDKTPEGLARAKACYRELLDSGVKAGMPPYRLGIDFMSALARLQGDQTQDLHRKMKIALDPNGVVSPGRYAR